MHGELSRASTLLSPNNYYVHDYSSFNKYNALTIHYHQFPEKYKVVNS